MRIIFLLQRLWPLFYIQFKILSLQIDFSGTNLAIEKQTFQNVHERDWIYLYASTKL